MKLMKMSVTVWYDCRPEFDCVQYEDELSPSGKAFQDRDDRNEKKCVELGKIWIEYNGNSRKPFWRALCIVENNGDAKSCVSKASELYDEAIKVLKWDSVSFIKNVEELQKPVDEELQNTVVEIVTGEMNGRKTVSLAEFKGSVVAASLQFGSQMAGEQRSEGYIRFFKSVITDEILMLLIRGLPLKIKGDMVEFESEASMNSSIEAIARKLSGDSVMRYLALEQDK